MNKPIFLRQICMSGVLALAVPLVYASTWHVDCGSTLTNPDFTDLHAALTGGASANGTGSVVANDIVNISGTCYAHAGPLAGTFTIPFSLTLQQDTSSGALPAILDGRASGTGTVTPLTSSPVLVSNGANVTLSGLTVQYGLGSSEYAGGISNGNELLHTTNNILTIQQSNIINNKSNSGTAGGIQNLGILNLQQSFIANNTSSFVGGGMIMVGPGTISESTIYSNSATIGGGAVVDQSNGEVVISQSTISGNSTSSNNGGGIWLYPNGAGTFVVSQSIITNNTDGGNVIDDINSSQWAGTSYIDQASQLVGEANANLAAPANNGGPTMTMKPASTSMALYANNNGATGAISTTGSGASATCSPPVFTPAITTTLPAEPTADQRGAPRPGIGLNGTVKAGCDIGAFETGQPLLASYTSLLPTPVGVTSYNFGTVNKGAPSQMGFYVKNVGNDTAVFSATNPIIIEDVSNGVTGTTPSTIFTQVPGAMLSTANLPVTQSAGYAVQFTPTANATYNAVVNIASNASVSPLVLNLSGTGAAFVVSNLTVIQNIIAYYNNAIASGGLVAENNNIPLLKKIEIGAFSGDLQAVDNALTLPAPTKANPNPTLTPKAIAAACLGLDVAYGLVGNLNNDVLEIIRGPDACNLQSQITALSVQLNCAALPASLKCTSSP